MDQQVVEPVTIDTKDEDIDPAQTLNINLKVEQKDRFAMLESNMIEDNFCNACGMEVEDTPQQEDHPEEVPADFLADGPEFELDDDEDDLLLDDELME